MAEECVKDNFGRHLRESVVANSNYMKMSSRVSTTVQSNLEERLEAYLIENNIPRKVLIEMNEPLRHAGYTFYQASFQDQGFYTYNDSYYYDTRFWKDRTVLAVVKNYGRLFPYISSIIMCIGILIHLLFKIPKKKNATDI